MSNGFLYRDNLTGRDGVKINLFACHLLRRKLDSISQFKNRFVAEFDYIEVWEDNER